MHKMNPHVDPIPEPMDPNVEPNVDPNGDPNEDPSRTQTVVNPVAWFRFGRTFEVKIATNKITCVFII